MTRQDNTKQVQRHQIIKQGCMTVAAAVAVFGACGSVNAFEIKSGSEDVVINWDNTLRYTLSQRLKHQSQELLNSANHDDGDRNFAPGLVSSRLDLLSEADVVYKKNYGIRVSGAGWYDPVYRDRLDNTSPGSSNHNIGGAPTLGLNAHTKDRFGGPNGELLDAFVFGKYEVGDVPVSVRAGRHTIYWGEAFFPGAGANSISYGQSPLDFAKALAMPGVELKEIFRPLNQVSVTIQPTKDITIAAQQYLQWESNVFPNGGTYLGMVDGLMNYGETYLFPWAIAGNAGDHRPKGTDDWGVKVAYSPEWLNGTLGFHYRKFSDKMPQILASNYIPAAPGVNLPTNFYYDYKSNIDLYGISFAKQIMGISVGSEISYRRNMPLTSQWFAPEGARGDTMHAIVNFLTLLPQSSFSDGGTAILEFSYGRWDKVTSGARYFTGNKNGLNVISGPTNDGVDAATRDNSVATIHIVPEWKQIMAGVDLAMPLNLTVGMHGNAATLTGGAKDSGSFSAGFSFDIYNKYSVDLTYASFFGLIHPVGNAGPFANQILPPGLNTGGQGAADPMALLKDRDLLSLTLKTSF